jgi:hypothetical protein
MHKNRVCELRLNATTHHGHEAPEGRHHPTVPIGAAVDLRHEEAEKGGKGGEGSRMGVSEREQCPFSLIAIFIVETEEDGDNGGDTPAKPEEIQGGGADDNHVIVVVIPPTRGGHDALDDVEHADVGSVEGNELWNIHPDGEESKRELSKDNFFPLLHIQFDHQI